MTPADVLSRYPEASRRRWLAQERASSTATSRARALLPILRSLPRSPLDPALVLALIKQESDVSRWSFNACCHGIGQINIGASSGTLAVDPYMPSQVIPWIYRRLVRLAAADHPRDARKMLSRYMEPYGPERGRQWNFRYADAVLSHLAWARSLMTERNPSSSLSLSWPAAATYIWRPSAEAVAAGIRNATKVVRGSFSPVAAAGQPVQLPLAPATRDYMRQLCAKFGLRPGGAARHPSKGIAQARTLRDPHEMGYAFDAYTSGDVGAAIADKLVIAADVLQLQIVIFANTMWVPGSRPWQAGGNHSSGNARHENHLHLELSAVSRAWTPTQIAAALERIR